MIYLLTGTPLRRRHADKAHNYYTTGHWNKTPERKPPRVLIKPTRMKTRVRTSQLLVCLVPDGGCVPFLLRFIRLLWEAVTAHSTRLEHRTRFVAGEV